MSTTYLICFISYTLYLSLSWGVDGYLMLARDNTNRCGIYYQGSAVEFEGGIIRGGTGGEQQQQQQPAEHEYARDGGHIFDFFHHY